MTTRQDAPPASVGAGAASRLSWRFPLQLESWLAARRLRVRLLLAALAGALATLALPPIGWIPVLVVALPVFALLAVREPRTRDAAWIGYAFGMGHFVTGLYWISAALFTDIASFWWALPLALLGLPAVLSLWVAGQAALLQRLAPGPLLLAPAMALCWGLQETVRTYALTGFPWNPIASIWAPALPVLQIDALTGPIGLGMLTVWVFAMPAAWLRPERRRQRALALATALPLLVLGGGTLWGALRLEAQPTRYAADAPQLRIVQAAIPQSAKWDSREQSNNVNLHLRATAEAPPGTRAAIWPETAVPFFLDEQPVLIDRIRESLAPDMLLITGAPREVADPAAYKGRRLYNSIMVEDSAGRLLPQVYDKYHLVPFGEYTPVPWVAGLAARVLGGGFTAGPGPQLLQLPGLPPAVPLICYEAIFANEVARGVNPPADASAPRPGWLVNATNDAWYGHTAGPYQHFQAARLRAIEEGLPLVRAANNGISGLVDPLGRIVASLDLDVRGTLDVKLPQSLEVVTPYAHFRDMPVFVLLALGLSVLSILRRRRSRGNC